MLYYNKYNLNSKKSIFVDDTIENVEAAKSVGMTGYHFDMDADKLRRALEM